MVPFQQGPAIGYVMIVRVLCVDGTGSLLSGEERGLVA